MSRRQWGHGYHAGRREALGELERGLEIPAWAAQDVWDEMRHGRKRIGEHRLEIGCPWCRRSGEARSALMLSVWPHDGEPAVTQGEFVCADCGRWGGLRWSPDDMVVGYTGCCVPTKITLRLMGQGTRQTSAQNWWGGWRVYDAV